MRIETVPLILGILIALLGLGIIIDAWTSDATAVSQERRRRPRVERHRNGEALIGFGVLGLAAAFIGRDSWRYSVLAVIIGAVFLVAGAILNRRYVRELFVNRGALRRRDEHEIAIAVADESTVPEAPERPLDRDGAFTRTDRDWNGTERRKTPRAGERRSARGGPDAPVT